MLFETLNQGNIFLVMLYYGIWSGIVFEAKNLIEKSLKNNKIISIIIDAIYMVICALLFVFAKNLANYGETRIYLLIGFLTGIVLEHQSIGYLVEKFFSFIYNNIKRLLCFVKTKLKQKISRKISRKKKNGTIKNLELS